MADPAPVVRVLTGADAPDYRAVRVAALRSDPLAFLTTADDFAARPLDSVASRLNPTERAVTLGAFVDGTLVGLLTVVREEAAVMAHRASVYGVSVEPGARGRGVGDALVSAALAQIRSWPGVSVVNLAVMVTQTSARRLYERHGFRVWGRQPDAVRRDGHVLAEDWMSLPLDERSSPPGEE